MKNINLKFLKKIFKSGRRMVVVLAVLLVLVVSIAFAGRGGIKPKLNQNEDIASTEAVSETEEIQPAADIVGLSPDGAQFPSLEVALPTLEPIPEVISIGAEHYIVAEIQERLMELGFMESDEPTEYYGQVTESAIKVFQRQNQVPQDGRVGETTLDLLMSDEAQHYAAKKGDSGTDITNIQTRLYELGYLADNGLVTGEFDDKTEQAVYKLQEVNGLTADGTVGMKTHNLIYSDEVKANMLIYGEKSDVVLAVQKRLFELGYLTRTPDGAYGDDTSIAVKLFQSKNGQVVDGYLGPSTRAAILAEGAVSNGLGLGDQSEQVINVQKYLVKWGYLAEANATGYFGEATEAAVKAFQSRNGLSSDGSVGAMTIAMLTSEDAKRPAPKSNNSNSGRSSNSGRRSGGGSHSGGTPAAPPAGNAPAYTGGGGVGTLLSVASSKVGSPYVWGAKGPNAFDCSGFVHWCLNNSGVSQSYITSGGWQNPGRYTRISNFSDIAAGDIVVCSGHVGIAAGGGAVIDASSSNGRVVRRSLSNWWARKFIVAWRIW